MACTDTTLKVSSCSGATQTPEFKFSGLTIVFAFAIGVMSFAKNADAQSIWDRLTGSAVEAYETFSIPSLIEGRWACSDSPYDFPPLGRVVSGESEVEFFPNGRVQGTDTLNINNPEGRIVLESYYKGSYIVDGRDLIVTVENMTIGTATINGQKIVKSFVDSLTNAVNGTTGRLRVQSIEKKNLVLYSSDTRSSSQCIK